MYIFLGIYTQPLHSYKYESSKCEWHASHLVKVYYAYAVACLPFRCVKRNLIIHNTVAHNTRCKFKHARSLETQTTGLLEERPTVLKGSGEILAPEA